MKIFVGGLSPGQQQAVQKAHPSTEFIFVSVADSPRRWGASLGNADAIVVTSKFNQHRQILALKSWSKLKINWANGGVSSVIKVIGDLLP